MIKEELSPGIVVYKNAIKDIDQLLGLMENTKYNKIDGGRDVDICYINKDANENLLEIRWILQASLNPCLEDYCEKYKVDSSKVLVNRFNNTYKYNNNKSKDNSNLIKFIYPTSPSPHKNIEVILHAASILENKNIKNFEIILTINGTENKYIKNLFNKFKYISQLKWVGFLNSEDLINYYHNVNALIFSSKLETWGLPITEFKFFNKPIIICNEPYAIETASNYNKLKYFNTLDELTLSEILEEFICKIHVEFDTPLHISIKSNLHIDNFENLLDYAFRKI